VVRDNGERTFKVTLIFEHNSSIEYVTGKHSSSYLLLTLPELTRVLSHVSCASYASNDRGLDGFPDSAAGRAAGAVGGAHRRGVQRIHSRSRLPFGPRSPLRRWCAPPLALQSFFRTCCAALHCRKLWPDSPLPCVTDFVRAILSDGEEQRPNGQPSDLIALFSALRYRRSS
jgi:hypothetical protein